MAKNFFEIGRLGRSQPTAIDYSEGLQPALDDLKARLDESKLKRDTLLSQMPAGVAIEKVPEVFRGKVTDFLTQNRQQYIEASKVIASGIRPEDERYINAMNTINSVRLRFDNLSNDLELYATTRKEALNQTNASLGVIGTLQTDHNNLASGVMTSTLGINEDGNITYANDRGKIGVFKDDFKLNYQAENSFATTKSTVRGELRVFKSQKGATYDSIREDALNAFDTFFNNTTIDGIRHAIFSDQDFMESVVAKLGVDTKDEEAVQRKISELVEMGDIENLKKQFKEFYTGEGGYFETYFNEQPDYEETVIPKDTDPLTSYRNRKTKVIDKLVTKETLTVSDIRGIGFPPVAISRENEQRKIKYNKDAGLLEIVLPASASTGYGDQVLVTFEVDENGNLIGDRTDIRNKLYSAHLAGDLIPESQVDFKGITDDIDTEVTPPQSLTVPEPPEGVEDANVFYRNINFSTFGAKNDIPVAEYNNSTNEYDIRYGKRRLKVPVSKLQSYFKLIGITDIRDVSNLANVLSSEEGSGEFNADANYVKKLGVSSLKELKDIISSKVILKNGKSQGPNKFSVSQIGIDAGGSRDASTLGYFVKTLRNYVKMVNEIKQQASE